MLGLYDDGVDLHQVGDRDAGDRGALPEVAVAARLGEAVVLHAEVPVEDAHAHAGVGVDGVDARDLVHAAGQEACSRRARARAGASVCSGLRSANCITRPSRSANALLDRRDVAGQVPVARRRVLAEGVDLQAEHRPGAEDARSRRDRRWPSRASAPRPAPRATSDEHEHDPGRDLVGGRGSLRPGQVAGGQDDREPSRAARARTWVRCRPWLSRTAKTTATPEPGVLDQAQRPAEEPQLRGTEGEREVDDRDDPEPAELARALAEHAVPQPRQQREHQPEEVRRGHPHRAGDRADVGDERRRAQRRTGRRSPGRSLPLFSIRAPCERTARSAVSTQRQVDQRQERGDAQTGQHQPEDARRRLRLSQPSTDQRRAPTTTTASVP